MREFIFCGKRLDNGEWVYGSLSTEYQQECGCVMISPTSDTCYKVDPETVGQFTGLVDKNGKKVFEDDVVVICYETDGEDFSETKRVHFNEQECCWYPMRWNECCEYCDHYTEVKSIEVIGNIHDNPELIGGGEDG